MYTMSIACSLKALQQAKFHCDIGADQIRSATYTAEHSTHYPPPPRGLYFGPKTIFIPPPPSENDIFPPLARRFLTPILFSLILPYFAFILPFNFPFSHFLSHFFLFLFPFFLFLLHFPPFSLRLFIFFPPNDIGWYFPPPTGGVGYFPLYRPLLIQQVQLNWC